MGPFTFFGAKALVYFFSTPAINGGVKADYITRDWEGVQYPHIFEHTKTELFLQSSLRFCNKNSHLTPRFSAGRKDRSRRGFSPDFLKSSKGNYKMKYIAFLRGINVTGYRTIKMEELRKMFNNLDYENVKTYIQSGNVSFDAPKIIDEAISKKLEIEIKKSFGFDVPVVIRTVPEIESIINGNPFKKLIEDGKAKLHVTFLSAAPESRLTSSLNDHKKSNDLFRLKGKEVYILCYKGYSDSVFSNAFIEKKLGVGATTRNWATVNRMLSL